MPSTRPAPKEETLRGRQTFILEGFPGISANLARRMLDYFGSLKRIFEASEEELASVKGIGPTKAKRMRELIGAGAGSEANPAVADQGNDGNA